MWDNDSAFRRAEQAWLEPPDEEEERCIKCDRVAEMIIGGEPYCTECAMEEFNEVGDYCDICEEEVDEGYKVGNTFYCEDCFLSIFGKERV